MTSRFKYGFVLLLLLAGIGLGLWLASEDGPGRGATTLTLDDDAIHGDEATRLAAEGRDPNDPEGPGLAPGASGSGNALVGARQPSGIDLSDPETRKAELTRLLQAGDWVGAAEIVALMTEPIPEELRGLILYELKSGKRMQSMHVFRVLRDPSFVQDLFDILDNPDLSKGAHSTALQALWQMPGAPSDAVALRLESRLNNDAAHDRPILFAIAARGGPEATRAMVEYIQRSQNPGDVPQHILQRMDMTKDPAAAQILTDALSTETDSRILKSLVKMATQNGARAFSEVLIGLDRDGIDEDVREQSLHALSQIGDEKAIGYLLTKAAEPGQFGEKALQSVAMISSADPEARLQITKALDEADKNPRPEKAKESLLLAIGAVGDKRALPAVAKQLDDRSADVQRAAVRAMGRLGPSAETYVSKLGRVYDQGDAQTRIHVAVAMGSIGGPQAISHMERALAEKGLSPSLERTLRMSLRNAKSRTTPGE